MPGPDDRKGAPETRDVLASFIEVSADAIVALDLQGKIVEWNPAAEEMFGFSAQDVVGLALIELIVPPRDVAVARERLSKIACGEGPFRYESSRRRKDGSLLDVSVCVFALRDPSGRVAGAGAIYRDITERKRYERELTTARDEALEGARRRSEFLANMSHEIRNPLNSIGGLTDMLLDTPLTETQRRHIGGVQASAGQLLEIINDILDFSKMSAGKLVLQEVDFDLEDAVYTELNLFAAPAQRKGLEVIASIEPNVPLLLRGDPARLKQVLANLLSNAVKFTERGEILVRVSKLGEMPNAAIVRFEVRDSGIGIPKEAQAQLFRPFSQVHRTATRKYGGTGLGLAIARELVERMGGTIGLASRSGAGSTFWFDVKLAKQAAAETCAPQAGGRLDRVRALIVDDNPLNREILKRQLQSWKMAPATAACPAEALEALRREAAAGRPYAIALLDMEMPEMDGAELARRIGGSPQIGGTPSIILSSAAMPAEFTGQGQPNVRGFLLKPVRASELRDRIVEALGGSRTIGRPGREGSRPNPPAGPFAGLLGHKLRVLVVEDNANNREVALWQLSKLGCRADSVADGQEALEALARNSYDLVLMDCRMPTMDGYEATRQIRRREGRARHTRIIAMTANALSGDREKCLAAGMDDYISKPVRLEALAAAMSRVLVPLGTAPAAAPSARAVDAGLAAPASAESLEAADGAHEAPVLDPVVLAELHRSGELLRRLIAAFTREAPEQLGQIARAIARHDLENAAITAHALKGTAVTFGASRMRESAAALENAADGGAEGRALSELNRLRGECERVSRELQADQSRQTP